MKKGVVCGVLLLAVSTATYAQRGPGPAVPSQGRGELRPHAWVRGFIGANASPNAGSLAPSQVNSAYGINIAGEGQGATVAIVDAYDAPNAAADLATFMSTFGISCSTGGGTFTKVNQNGAASPLPGYNSGWELEENLDVQWERAIAPCANIVLVEANSNNDSDLLTAVSTAASLGSVVAMSWGGSEFGGQTSFDGYFLKSGVTFLASSGDTGGIVEWPSASINVIGVGGTDLAFNPDGSLASETAWNGSGGGCSTQEPPIAPQTGFVPGTCTTRAAPDVSMDGGTSVQVYISKQGGWYGVYGTSLAVQLWGGVIALANGARATPLNGTLADLYTDAAGAPSSSLYTGNYRDITSGSAGSFTAGAGWDFITGLGSPLVSTLVPSYLETQGTTADFSVSISGAQTTYPGGPAKSYTLTATGQNGFSGTVSWSFPNGLPSGVTATPDPPAAGNSSPFTLTASLSATPGTYNITVTGTSGALAHNTTAVLTIGTPDFSVSVTGSQTVPPGGTSNNYTLTATPLNGFSGTVNWSFGSLPAGITAAPNPPAPGNSSTFKLTATTAGPGSYNIPVTGKSGTLTHATSTTLVVSSPTFSLTITPSSQSVTRPSGGTTKTVTYTVAINPIGGFNESVTLGASGGTTGIKPSITGTNPVPFGSTGTLSVLVTSSAKKGNRTLTVTGSAAGTTSKTATASIQVK